MSTRNDWEFVRCVGDGFMHCVWNEVRAEAERLTTKRVKELGCDYQPYLYGIIRLMRPYRVVETGVRAGVSTYFALHALAKQPRNSGALWSCDPMYRDKDEARARVYRNLSLVDTHRWAFDGEPSSAVLPRIPPPWDIFVHDSDHSRENMLWELQFAWDRLRPNGVLICDNFDWGNENYPHVPHKRHDAWEAFLAGAGIKEYSMLGSQTAAVVKPQ